MIEIHQIPVLDSNFTLIVECTRTGDVAIVDTPSSKDVISVLDKKGLKPRKLLITHHHADHTDGIDILQKRYDLKVFGPKREADQIRYLDVELAENARVKFGNGHFTVISTPGHTHGHIAYFLEQAPTLFAGDALFSLGCGRMFDGPADQMWEGLKKIRTLPDETILYCGHDYTVGNAEFALSVDPKNKALQQRYRDAVTRQKDRQPTLPTTLGIEKMANPFLRADNPDLAAAMGTSGKPDFETFAALRAAKDRFR